jgi:hypothetical protein
MKYLQLVVAFTILFFVTSCVTTVPINKGFYGTTKVGVIIQMDENASVIKASTDGTVETITAPDNRFHIGLEKVKSKIVFKEILEKEIFNTLTVKNKSFEMISDNFNDTDLKKFKTPDIEKEYSKSDFRFMKEKHNVDEILFVKVNYYGLLLVYSGVLLATKKGYVMMHTQVIDLKDNSLLQQKLFETNVKIKGNWKSDGEYTNLQTAIQTAIDQSILKFKQRL